MFWRRKPAKPPRPAPPDKHLVRVTAHRTRTSIDAHVRGVTAQDFSLHPVGYASWREGDSLSLSWTLASEGHQHVHTLDARVKAEAGGTFGPAQAYTCSGLIAGEIENLRTSPRVPVSISATCEVLTSINAAQRGKRLQVQLIDISQGGASFETGANFAPGDQVRLIFDGHDEQGQVLRISDPLSSWRTRVSLSWLRPLPELPVPATSPHVHA